jgi:hypothetical protein
MLSVEGQVGETCPLFFIGADGLFLKRLNPVP